MSAGEVTLGGMKSELPYPLRKLARYQSGVVSRSQALQAGLTADAIKFRVRRGRWQQIHPGVYAIFSGPLGRGSRLWAAVLSAGQGAVLSHETAAELNGLTDKRTNPIHVTVPSQRHIVAVPGISTHRSNRALAAAQDSTYPPRTKIEETVLDLAEAAGTFDDVCGWVTRAFARELTDEDRLHAAMGGRARLRWRADLHEVIVAAAGGDHSVLEFRYGWDVERAHGLPRPSRQVRFTGPGGRRGRRDRVYDEYGVVVELDGKLGHEDPRKDKARDNAAAATGKQSLRYGWDQVRWHACEVALEVASVLRVNGWDGSPHPCSPACSVGTGQ
jgi:hypothetical protein